MTTPAPSRVAARSLGDKAVGTLRADSADTWVHSEVPVQRIGRDVQTLHQRALMPRIPNSARYGRILGGQEPTRRDR